MSENRSSHAAAKAYDRYFLENAIAMLLPTVVIAEFAVKQSPEELPLQRARTPALQTPAISAVPPV
jgi:hypothetical protein